MTDDLISRAEAIYAVQHAFDMETLLNSFVRKVAVDALKTMPSAQSEPEEFEWCNGCKEYDQEKHCCHRWTKVIRKTVDEIKADPVRHGHWIKEFENEDGRNLRCSECRMVFYVGKGRDGNYCPECGARMDAEREEE
jgi:uncharacterized paraquat-inducible protein A